MAPKARGRQPGSTAVAALGDVKPDVKPFDIGGSPSLTRMTSLDGTMPAPSQEAPGTSHPRPLMMAPEDVKPQQKRGASEPRTPVSGTPQPQQQEQRFGKRGSGQAFALGLFQILKTEDPSIIGWSASGKAFRITDSERFCRDIMPRFFKQNKYSSFQRQLNLYGFRKLVRGNEAGGYMHPLFERGKPEQLSQVRRGFFPEIPPEFAHDVHGHGMGEPGDSSGAAPTGTPSRAASRGRKSEPQPHSGHSDMGPPGSGMGPRSSSVGRSPQPPGMLASMSGGAAGVASSAAAGGGARGVLNGKLGGDGRGYQGGGAGVVDGQGCSLQRTDHGHVRSGSASVVVGQHGQMVNRRMNADWNGVGGPLPSLDVLTSGLRGHGMHVNINGQGGGGEMPPATLGRLGDPHESSPIGGSERMHEHRRRGSTNMEPPDRLPAFGRSQDDLSVLSPRATLPEIMGMQPPASMLDSYGRDPTAGYYQHQGRWDHALDLYGSNGSSTGGTRGQRPLQHRHSRDDLDALRPRKSRRTGPSFQSNEGGDDAQAFLASSPRRDTDGLDGFDRRGGGDTRVPFLPPSTVSYATPDEVPPAPPGRLVSRHSTPSRPERPEALNNLNGGSGGGSVGLGGSAGGGGSVGGSDGGSGHGHQMHLGESSTMDAEDAAHPPGMGHRSRKNNFAAQGFFAAVSPVSVNAAYSGFSGGRRNRQNLSGGGAQQGQSGGNAQADGHGRDSSAAGTAGTGWRVGEISPEGVSTIREDSPSSSPSGRGSGGNSGGSGGSGGGGMGGLGLTAHAMSRMEKVKTSRQDPTLPGDSSTQPSHAASGNGGGVGTLGENLSQLDLGEPGANGRPSVRGGNLAGGGGVNSSSRLDGARHTRDMGAGGTDYDRRGQASHLQEGAGHEENRAQNHPHRRQNAHYTQPVHDDRDGSRVIAGGERPVGAGHHRDGSGNSPRRPTPAEAAELLRRRSSVDEVIGLLTGSGSADGMYDFESGRTHQTDPALFDSWRNSLTKVLGHLGFDFEDENGDPVTNPDGGKGALVNCHSNNGTSQYLSWGGASQMSFDENPADFHDNLRQIPMRWRSSLSSIMNSMASNGALDEGGADGGTLDTVEIGPDGKPTGERKRLEQQASLEMLQSVMRETLESMSQGADNRDGDESEAEAKAAAEAVCVMDSIRRANADGIGDGHAGDHGGGGVGTLDAYDDPVGIRADDPGSVLDSSAGMDPYYHHQSLGRGVGQMHAGPGGGSYHHAIAQGTLRGGGGMHHDEQHASF